MADRIAGFDVTGIGANSIDRVLRIAVSTAELLESGKTQIAGADLFHGGQTATVVAACAAMGLRARYVGVFGSDPDARKLRADLAARGVDVSDALDADAPNASATIVVDPHGRRTVLWQRDDGLRMSADDVQAAMQPSSRVIHLDDVDGAAALDAAREARKLGVPVTSDLEQVHDGTEALIAAVSHPIFDHNAPGVLTGERDPERALRKLRPLNPGLLCMTLGEQGAAALEGDRFVHAPAVKIQAVDTTGAGDVFRAGFIYGLLRDWSVPDILRFANAAAAISCTRPGAIASVPTLDEIDGFRRRAAETQR